jgi:hypothetical protein
MGARGAIPQVNSTSSWNANPVSPRSNFSARPIPTVPSINTSDNIPSIPMQPTTAKPLPTLNSIRTLPVASATQSTLVNETTSNMNGQPSNYTNTKPLPLSPRQYANPSPEMTPVTPRSQWNDTTRTVVDRKPLPIPQPVIQPNASPSYFTNTGSNINAQNAPSNNFSSNNILPSSNTTSTPNPSSYNSGYNSASSNQPIATVVQNLTEFPPTPSKVPKMEKLKSGDVVRLQSTFWNY